MTVPAPQLKAVDFSALFATLPHPYVAFTPDLVIVAVSDGFCRETMTRREDLLGRPLGEAFPSNPNARGSDGDALRASIETALQTGDRSSLSKQNYDIRRPSACGGTYETRYWNITNMPIRGADGAVAYVIQCIEDVTDPVLKAEAAEDRFRFAEERFEATFEQNAVGIAHVAPDGHFLQINGRFGDMLGYGHEEMLHKNIHDLTHPDDLQRSMSQVTALLSGTGLPYTIEKRYIRKDGTSLWVRVTRALVRDTAGKPAYFVAVMEDVSARKAAEADLLQREAYLQSILDTVPDGMIVINDQGIIESVSRTAERLFGYTGAEIVGRNIKILMPSGDRERHDGYMTRYKETNAPRIIGIGRVVTGARKDGSTFAFNLSVGETSTAAKRQFVGFVQDLTERQAAEARMRELQAELVHISRFTALGEMASTLAHELNQPLTAITNFLRGCRRLLTQGIDGNLPLLSDAIDQAADQALRAGQIIRRLRAFVERGESERSGENLPKLIEEACALALVGAAERGIHVTFALDPTTPLVFVDRIQIQQVLLNLIRNAIEAMQNGPRRELLIATAVKPDGMVEVSVGDTGIGLTPDVAAHLFQPFITTKPMGMGVGLSICRTIIEAHEGKITAVPNPGGGTLFRFTLRGLKPEETNHGG